MLQCLNNTASVSKKVFRIVFERLLVSSASKQHRFS